MVSPGPSSNRKGRERCHGWRSRAGRWVVMVLAWVSVGFVDTGLAGDWPQWRGPRRDGHAASDEVLPDPLPATLSPRWQVPAGGGFASPIVVGDRVYLVDEQAGRETARALEASTGKEVWRQTYADAFGDEWGSGPRCTPVAADGRLFVQAIRGALVCLDLKEGRRLWGVDFAKDYGVGFLGGSDQYDAASRRRGHNGAPVVSGDRVYVAVGSTNGATLVCFEAATGRERWRAGRDETAYAALMTGRLAGQEQVVAYTAFSLLGLAAADGSLLWRIPLKTHANRHAVTPLLLGDQVVVSSHSIGIRQFSIAAGPEGVSARPGWAQPGLKTSLATLVEVGGSLYGQGPNRNFHCLDARTGEVRWSQSGYGEQALVAYAATLAVGDRLLVATERGELVVVAADPAQYRELARYQVCGKTWSHPALSGGRLFLRDRREWYAFDLSSAGAGTPGGR